jgi:hypothetical protein
MPRKRKSVTASIQNGQRSGESREVKRKRTEDRRTVVDKENFEVSPRHNLMTLPSILSEGPSKTFKGHSQFHAQLTPSLRGSYKQVPTPHGGLVRPSMGHLRGMAVILEERGYSVKDLRAECKGFNAHLNLTAAAASSSTNPILQMLKLFLTCRSRGFQVIFLPKFHVN